MQYYTRNLIVLWTTNFMAACSWTMVMPFLPLFIQELGVQDRVEAWAGIAFSINFLFGAIMSPIWGSLADRYGRKPMIIRAGIALSIIYFLTSIVQAPWQLIVVRALNGALTGFIPGATALVATNTPQDRVGRYLGTLQTAPAAGTILGPVIGGVLADFMGYRQTLMIPAIALLVATFFVVIGVEERRKGEPPRRQSLIADFQTAFSLPVLTTVMVAMAFTQLAILSLEPILTLFIGGLLGPGTAHWIAGAVFSLPGLAFVLAAPWWSRYGERVGFGTVLAIGLFGAGLLFLPQGLVGSIWQFAVLRFAAGILLAAVQPAAASLIATRVAEDFRGRAYGVYQTAVFVGNLAGPLLGGFVGTAVGPRAVFVLTGVLLLGVSLWLRQMIPRALGESGRPARRPVATSG